MGSINSLSWIGQYQFHEPGFAYAEKCVGNRWTGRIFPGLGYGRTYNLYFTEYWYCVVSIYPLFWWFKSWCRSFLSQYKLLRLHGLNDQGNITLLWLLFAVIHFSREFIGWCQFHSSVKGLVHPPTPRGNNRGAGRLVWDRQIFPPLQPLPTSTFSWRVPHCIDQFLLITRTNHNVLGGKLTDF